MPCRATSKLFAFKQHNILPAKLSEVIGDRTANHTTTNDYGARLCGNAHETTPSSLHYPDHIEPHHRRDAPRAHVQEL